MVESTMAYSVPGSSGTTSKSLCDTSAFTQSRYRLNTVFQLPNEAGRSRQLLSVGTIHPTASTNRRLFPQLRPGSLGQSNVCSIGIIRTDKVARPYNEIERNPCHGQVGLRSKRPNVPPASFPPRPRADSGRSDTQPETSVFRRLFVTTINIRPRMSSPRPRYAQRSGSQFGSRDSEIDQRLIMTGRSAFSSTCRVTPPNISCRRRECE